MPGMYIRHIRAPNTRSYGFSWPKKSKTKRQTANATLASLETRKRNAKTPINVKRIIPSKQEMREYCMQDANFAKAYKKSKAGGVGQSFANTERHRLQIIIVEELPFGPILP